MKLTFVGAGRVGSAAAFSVLHAVDAVKDIVMLDMLPILAEGEAEDLTHAAYAMGRKVKVTGTSDYAATEGSAIYVVTAGFARRPGQSRDDPAKANYSIVRSVGESIAKHSKSAIVITATNPADVMNYVMFKATGFPRERIIGMGGVLDTARLHALGHNGLVVGAHGETMTPTEKIPAEELRRLLDAAPSVIAKKGGTVFGPAVALDRMVYAIANDTKEILPCSCVLDGEFGLHGVSIGVPAVLGRKGVEKISGTPMPEGFAASAEAVKAQIAALGL